MNTEVRDRGTGAPPAAPAPGAVGPTSTPMMTQYLELKKQAGDAILFYRMGDFYEMFYEDAEIAARICDLTLTSRNKSDPDPIPMAGVPWHSAEPYLQRLLQAGYRVAICEQVERPGGRGLMERAIVEVLTPGTALAEHLLAQDRNNNLVAVVPGKDRWGLATADISTGEFGVGEVAAGDLSGELDRLAPREILFPRERREEPALASYLSEHRDVFQAPLDDWLFSASRSRKVLLEQWGVASLEPFGIERLGLGVAAGGALVAYAREQRRAPLAHLRAPRAMRTIDGLQMDEATLRNLEVLESLTPGARHSLLAVVDRTQTPMGARLLRRTLAQPLLDVSAIRGRHRAVGALTEDRAMLERLRALLAHVGDIERLVARLHSAPARPQDLARLRDCLAPLPDLASAALQIAVSAPFPTGGDEVGLAELCTELDRALAADPLRAPAGEAIRDGHDADLDAQRDLARGGERWLAQIQQREREATGISSLKVGHNKVFGYFIEVTKPHLARVPSTYERKQTLVGAERFVTPELKAWEEKILGAREAARERQDELIEALRQRVVGETRDLQHAAEIVAQWDLVAGFAQRAIEGRYICPEVDEGDGIRIVGGRHPVVERFLEGETFVPNDVEVDGRNRQILIITGPNMAGKSTYLRQTGLLVLLAQAGSFIPAEEARIGVADRLFTRVGAGDRIAAGQSTFLVEMIETSRILHEATGRSLVLFDEVGRGTSTFDGLAIAWAVAEHLRDRPLRRPRTLFATHFHELTELARRREGYCNLNVEVKEWQDRVIFVRRVVEGAADRSYGVHVAQLAGLPKEVLARAREILGLLEEHGPRDLLLPGSPAAQQAQITLFGAAGRSQGAARLAGRVADALAASDQVRTGPAAAGSLEAELRELIGELAAIEPDRLAPREALELIYRWKQRWGKAATGDV
jgi:DNA mismatch repair protein MutS